MWVFALEWAYILRKLGWLSKWGFGWFISGHLSVCPGPHSPVKLKSERLPQNLPWIESTGNLSGATVIEINWILEIITFMLMWVLRRDNSPGDKYLREVGWKTLLSQLERLGILVGWVGCCCISVPGSSADEAFELLPTLSPWISVIYHVHLDNWNNKDEMNTKDLLFHG